jgi:putative transposase
LKELLAEIATQNGFEILAVEVMPDHVHLFVSAPPKFSPAEIVRLFKGITSHRLRKEFESIRHPYWGGHATLWAEGYYLGTAGHVSAETIQRYIEESQQKSYQGWMCTCLACKANLKKGQTAGKNRPNDSRNEATRSVNLPR